MNRKRYYPFLCKCGCGGKIRIKYSHKQDGIPSYLLGHHTKGKNHPLYGKKHSEETKKKIGKSNSGKEVSIETRLKISKANKGRPCPEDRKIKISKARLGHKVLEETKRKLRQYRGPKHHGYGKPVPMERRVRISNSKKGSIFSESHKKNIALSKRGKHNGQGNPMFGRHHSDEAKLKISMAHQGKYVGENNPNFNGWSSRLPYGKEWEPKLKKRIAQRDGYLCKYCGVLAPDGCPHHINYNKLDCRPINLVWVHNRCNNKFNVNRENWIDFWCKRLNINKLDLASDINGRD